MRVHLVDPAAYTPPYDHALAGALARAGATVELITGRFPHGPVPREEGYEVRERFYRRASRPRLRPGARRAARAAEHLPDMLAYRREADRADVVHYQWLPIPALDRRLPGPTPAPRLHDALAASRGANADRPDAHRPARRDGCGRRPHRARRRPVGGTSACPPIGCG